jgi:hypothetical protein
MVVLTANLIDLSYGKRGIKVTLEDEVEEIRYIRHCTIACKNCEFQRHCDYCGVDFCGLYRYEEYGEWAHDKNGDVMCPECVEINPEQISIASNGILASE